MRFKGLDLNLLTALDALLTYQNVTLAAKHVKISQSTMSGALARLRTHFDDELLVQVHRRMVLTPLASSLTVALRTLLAETSKLLDVRSGFDPATARRRFTISCSDYIWAVLISEVMPSVATLAPRVQLHYAGPSARFAEGDIDLLITPENFIVPEHLHAPLFVEDYLGIVWTGNTLVKTSLSEANLLELEQVVALSSRRTFIQEWFVGRYGDKMRIAVIAPNFTLVPLSIVGTNHLGIVPRRLALYSKNHLPLRVLAMPVEIPPMVDVIQWRAYQDNDQGLHWLRNLIKEAAQRLFAQPVVASKGASRHPSRGRSS
jgi:LysR family nod box-dependent transcriptional activator